MRRPRGTGGRPRTRTGHRVAEPVGTTYELWNARTRNLIQTFGSEAEALDAVRAIVGRHGVAYAERMVLAAEDRNGRSTTIAQGSDLLARAEVDPIAGATAAHDLAHLAEAIRTVRWADDDPAAVEEDAVLARLLALNLERSGASMGGLATPQGKVSPRRLPSGQ